MPTYRVIYELTDEPGDVKVVTLTCLHEVPDDALGDLLPAGVALATDRDLLARIRVRRWRRLDVGRPPPFGFRR